MLERGITETGKEVSGNLDTVYVSRSGSSADQRESLASTATPGSSDSVGVPATASDGDTADGGSNSKNTVSTVDNKRSTEQSWTAPLAYGTGALGVMALLAILIPLILLCRRHEKDREYRDMDQL